jgi:arginyl-tRNA synthetase
VTPAQLSEALRAALVHAVDDGTFALDPAAIPATVHLERPRQRDHGDWATNVAMQLAKKAGTNPRAFAEELARRLAQTAGVATVEVAGPGFLNIRLDAAAAGELARSVVEQGRGPSTGRTRRSPASRSTSSSSPPTRRARCTSAACAGRPSATAWRACSRRPVPR